MTGSGPAGSVTLNVEESSNFTAPIEEGEYFVSYFARGDYYEPVNRCYFSVGRQSCVESPMGNGLAVTVTGNVINVSSPGNIESLELLSISGAVVKRQECDSVNDTEMVADVPGGVYVLKINGSEAKKIAL